MVSTNNFAFQEFYVIFISAKFIVKFTKALFVQYCSYALPMVFPLVESSLRFMTVIWNNPDKLLTLLGKKAGL